MRGKRNADGRRDPYDYLILELLESVNEHGSVRVSTFCPHMHIAGAPQGGGCQHRQLRWNAQSDETTRCTCPFGAASCPYPCPHRVLSRGDSVRAAHCQGSPTPPGFPLALLPMCMCKWESIDSTNRSTLMLIGATPCCVGWEGGPCLSGMAENRGAMCGGRAEVLHAAQHLDPEATRNLP